MTDQAKEEYLVPGAKAHMFHSALERKIEIFTKRARNYLRQVLKKYFLDKCKRGSPGLHHDEMTLYRRLAVRLYLKTLLKVGSIIKVDYSGRKKH